MIVRARAFLLFWYRFIVGDDWLLTAGVVLALAASSALPAWWVVPATTAILLPASLWRAGR